jgi:sugar-specific transcriptional regulator TrmB
MKNFIPNLKEAGLTENEAKIYSSLLETGPKTATTIAKRTRLHRRVIYDATERLIQKGIVGHILENGRKIFKASSPKRVLEILKEKEKLVESDMQEMLALFNQEKDKVRSETQFYKGIEGLKTIFEDQIEQKKEILILGASPLAYEMLNIYFHWFDKRRQENKIKIKIIFKKTERKYRLPLAEIKYLPEKYSSDMAINIYGDRVAIILWKKDKPVAILIKDQEIAEGYKKQFELMWKIAKE